MLENASLGYSYQAFWGYINAKVVVGVIVSLGNVKMLPHLYCNILYKRYDACVRGNKSGLGCLGLVFSILTLERYK